MHCMSKYLGCDGPQCLENKIQIILHYNLPSACVCCCELSPYCVIGNPICENIDINIHSSIMNKYFNLGAWKQTACI